MNKISIIVITTCIILLNSCGATKNNVSFTPCDAPKVLNELAKNELISNGNDDDMVTPAPNGGYKTLGGSLVTQEYVQMKLTDALEKKLINKATFDNCVG